MPDTDTPTHTCCWRQRRAQGYVSAYLRTYETHALKGAEGNLLLAPAESKSTCPSSGSAACSNASKASHPPAFRPAASRHSPPVSTTRTPTPMPSAGCRSPPPHTQHLTPASTPSESTAAGALRCQYWYLCTSKASKLAPAAAALSHQCGFIAYNWQLSPSAYVSICQHTSACVSIRAEPYGSARTTGNGRHLSEREREGGREEGRTEGRICICQHTSAHVSICQHTSACLHRATPGSWSTYPAPPPQSVTPPQKK